MNECDLRIGAKRQTREWWIQIFLSYCEIWEILVHEDTFIGWYTWWSHLNMRFFFFLFLSYSFALFLQPSTSTDAQLFQQFSTHARRMHKYINNFSLLPMLLITLILPFYTQCSALLVCIVWFWMRNTRNNIDRHHISRGKIPGIFSFD